jgi:hypothetical protein
MSYDAGAISVQQYAVDLSASVARQDGGSAAAILSLHDRLAVQRIYRGLPYSTARSISDNPHLQEFRHIFLSSQLDPAGQTAWSTVASKHIAAVVHLAQISDTDDENNQALNQAAFEAQLDLAKCVQVNPQPPEAVLAAYYFVFPIQELPSMASGQYARINNMGSAGTFLPMQGFKRPCDSCT